MVKGAVRGDVDVEVRGYRWHALRAEGAQNALVIGAAWLDPLCPAISEYLLEHLTRMVAARLGLLFAERILSKSAPMESFTLSSADLTASSVCYQLVAGAGFREDEMLLPRELGWA